MSRAEVNLHPDDIKALVMQHYAIPVDAVQKVRAIYKVETPSGSFGFKNAEELHDLPQIADYLARIGRNGFVRMPGIVPTNGGSYSFPHNGEFYFMEQWLEMPELPKESFAYLHAIGRTLAAFHRAAGGIIPSVESSRFDWGKRHEHLLRAFHHIRDWKQQPLHQSAEKRILDFLQYRCYLALDYIKDVSPQALIRTCPDAAVLCHGGLHHKNILVDSRNRIWFIDFETMVFAERVMDLAQFLQYHASPYRWNPAVVNTFLSAYDAGARLRICADEWSLFFSYLAFPRRFHNRMLRYFGDPQRPPEFLEKLVETMEQDMAKERYLNMHKPAASIQH